MHPIQTPPLERQASCYDLRSIFIQDPRAIRLWLIKQITLLENSLEFANSDTQRQQIEMSIARYRNRLNNLQQSA